MQMISRIYLRELSDLPVMTCLLKQKFDSGYGYVGVGTIIALDDNSYIFDHLNKKMNIRRYVSYENGNWIIHRERKIREPKKLFRC